MKPGYFLIPILLIVIVVAGCSKGSTSKHPKLSLESVSTDTLDQYNADSVTFMLKFENSGGTLGNGSFFSVRVRLNTIPVPVQDSAGKDSLVTQIPDFNGASKGEFKYGLGFGDLSQGTLDNLNDTLIIKFFAVTPNNDTSNVVSSPQLVIINHM